MTLARVRHLPYVFFLTIIVGLGLYLRLRGLPDQMPFFGDVGRTYVAGQSILDGNLTLQGPKTSVGSFHLGPLYYYLTALALWLSGGNVIGPAVMVALGGGIAIVLLSEYLRRELHWRAGLLAGSIMAFSPLVVEQSRIPIEPSLVPLFTVLWLWITTTWWRSSRIGVLFLSFFIVLLGAQLNFSFVVLGAVSAFAFVWKSVPSQLRFWMSSLVGMSLIIMVFLKIAWRGTTTAVYFWQMWQRYSFPHNEFVAGVFLFATALSVSVLVKQKSKLPTNVREILSLWYFWGFFSVCAFFLKTVGGNHALAMLFPLPPILIATALTSLVKPRVFAGISIFIAIIWLISGITTSPQESTLTQAQGVVLSVLKEANNKPYELVYRGHLDVYEAVDDHWQFLLARTENPPSSGRKLYLYSPHTATERFAHEGREVVIDKDYLLQVSE